MSRAQTFFQGISFRLAKIGVVIAFALGICMSLVELYLDFQSHRQDSRELINRVVQVATPPASRAVHTLDNDLSEEVVNGLLAYDFIYRVNITDELGNSLAQGEKARIESDTRWLTNLLTDARPEYHSTLSLPGYSDSVTGGLTLWVDRDQALSGFYQRAQRNFVTGLLRDSLVILLLFIVFHLVLTKPLIRLANAIKRINPDKPGANRLPAMPHRKDELGQLVESSNQLLNAVELALAKRRAGELALRKSEEHLRQIIDALPVMIGARNERGAYLFANRALADLLGTSPGQMRDQDVRELLKRSVHDMKQLLANDRRVIEEGCEIDIPEEPFVTVSGQVRYLQTHIMPLQFYDQRVAMVVSVDVTERKNAQAKMEYMAHHDALTRLPNRVYLVDRLEMELHRANRHGYCGAVLFIDLDQFKNINDSLGHPVGDEMLKEVAKRLSSAVRDEDLVARLSGDEFVVVLTVLDKKIEEAALRAGEISEKIRQLVAQPYTIDEMELRVSCSIGVAVYPDKKNDVHELLRYADTAMYQVKDKGRDAIAFFNEEMAERVSRQLVMEGDLHRALEEKQFQLHYHPKIDMGTGQVVGAEALLRWKHPVKGTISPAEFIPVLETSGLIIEVGQWVLETACATLKHWQEAGWWKKGMSLSVNISPRQFRREAFVEDVLDILARYDLPDKALEMEVTEGILIHQVDDAIETMGRLAQEGVSFSLDDFGTGYSSISYLKQLPVAVLKIDKSFIRDIVEDRNDRVLVETIITMGRLLDLEVVAEGVEVEEQFDILQKYGCHYYQGFYFSPAVSLADFDRFFSQQAELAGR